VKYFGGGVTMEYLENLSIPEFLELNDETIKIAEQEKKKYDKEMEKSYRGR
jgi:hypothetical protein